MFYPLWEVIGRTLCSFILEPPVSLRWVRHQNGRSRGPACCGPHTRSDQVTWVGFFPHDSRERKNLLALTLHILEANNLPKDTESFLAQAEKKWGSELTQLSSPCCQDLCLHRSIICVLLPSDLLTHPELLP